MEMVLLTIIKGIPITSSLIRIFRGLVLFWEDYFGFISPHGGTLLALILILAISPDLCSYVFPQIMLVQDYPICKDLHSLVRCIQV